MAKFERTIPAPKDSSEILIALFSWLDLLQNQKNGPKWTVFLGRTPGNHG
ncbi:MAG: hypothetical protein HRU31_07170 [Rhodobacteraceae bacterium]|nr:hypothetical protein [Paracoccaceae bacterium]